MVESTVSDRISRILIEISEKNVFCGILLIMLGVDLNCDQSKAWIDDNSKIYINPDYVEKLTDDELRYVLLHLIYQVILSYVEEEEYEDKELYDRAQDIVSNSYIYTSEGYNKESITLDMEGGVQEHYTPDGFEACKYSVKEVYEMLNENENTSGNHIKEKDNNEKNCKNCYEENHTMEIHDELDKVFNSAFTMYAGMFSDEQDFKPQVFPEKLLCKMTGKKAGTTANNTIRTIKDLKKVQTDWKGTLDIFLSQDYKDYSFTPPDRRYSDSPFFLPNYVEEESPEKILFMIDTSGSMQQEAIEAAYSEVKGAIEQFDGKLKGWLGFFDSEVKKPQPFCDEDEFLRIIPRGGGGTSFSIIFDYVRNEMIEDRPKFIVILTDGYARYPGESEAMDIPVLWLFTTDVEPPTWGKIARITL